MVFAVPGQLDAVAVLDGSLVSALLVFVWQGVVHILVGLDHVLLVVCLALGFGASPRLIWPVTAFTLGHSVTLAAAVLGLRPDWPWFIPLVEAAIAATVLMAAIAAWYGRALAPTQALAGIAAVGLLHGFGFASVLGDILGPEAPNLVAALAAFNVGIELGQLAILALTLAIVAALRRLSIPGALRASQATLVGIAVIAGYWLIERALLLT